MEHNTPSLTSAPYDMHFQVSLLRLIYSDAKVSAHVAELEQMLAPSYVILARN